MRHRVYPSLLLLLFFCSAPAVANSYAVMNCGPALKYADQVIVGRIVRLIQDSDGYPLAEIEVSETWRGQPVDRLQVWLRRDAVPRSRPSPAVGQRALFLLTRPSTHPWPVVSQRGLGYLPIITIGGEDYVRDVWSDDFAGSVTVKEGPGDVGRCYQSAGLKAWAQVK